MAMLVCAMIGSWLLRAMRGGKASLPLSRIKRPEGEVR